MRTRSGGRAVAVCLGVPLMVGVGAGACGSCGGTPAADRQARPSRAAAATERPGPEKEPPPWNVRVYTQFGRGGAVQPSQLAWFVENHGPNPVRLAMNARLERSTRTGWKTLPETTELKLRYSCATPPADCITLAPGAALHPPPLEGSGVWSQCRCEACSLEAGTYRLSVTNCDGQQHARSEQFSLPPKVSARGR